MLGAPEPTHLDRLAATGVRLERQVVEATRLPAVGLGDPALGPREHLFLEPEFGHRLNGLQELTRSAQVAAEQLHDRVGVAVETARRSRAYRTANDSRCSASSASR